MPVLALPEGGEWIVILVIVVLLFGANKLPELTRNAARAMKEFDKARNGDDEPGPQRPSRPRPQPPQQCAAPPHRIRSTGQLGASTQGGGAQGGSQ